ncbi:MAG: SGNH/GDSL hydrolase family protein [Actinomycetes bacterium]
MDTALAKISFAVIGDSAAYGVGDAFEDQSPRGWAWFVANNLQAPCHYSNYSRPGAKSDEVREIQLQRALQEQPNICAVIVGGNDLLRNGFSPERLYTNLKAITEQLLDRGSEVIMVELHDPGLILKIPELLKRVLRRRVNAANSVYHRIAAEFNIVLIRTRKIPNVHDKANWHVDRMHPGPIGHQLLANEICRNLGARGWPAQSVEIQGGVQSSQIDRWLWMLRKGTPWFLKRSVDLLPVALFLMAREALSILFSSVLGAPQNQDVMNTY